MVIFKNYKQIKCLKKIIIFDHPNHNNRHNQLFVQKKSNVPSIDENNDDERNFSIFLIFYYFIIIIIKLFGS